jgi:Cu-Zn family superoxide dismutase
MKNHVLTAIAAIIITAVGAAAFADGRGEARLKGPDGKLVGTAALSETTEGVIIVVQVSGLAPGYHGFHIHETGSCLEPDFKSAGGHFNPFGKEHGRRNPQGPHAGDLPNLLVDPLGQAVVVVSAPLVTLGSGVNSLFKSGGTAFVIHSGPDDHLSQPTGSAGGRAACGRILPMK